MTEALYALAPRLPPPISGAAVSSSGQRGRAIISPWAWRSPDAKRSSPAQAIMAPLSVQSLKGGATKQQLLDAMTGHVLGEGQLVGVYER